MTTPESDARLTPYAADAPRSSQHHGVARARSAEQPGATAFEQTDDLSKSVAQWQAIARECSEQTFANWGVWIATLVQRNEEWADGCNRAFATWCAWWPASFGLRPLVSPLAGCVNAWLWGYQNALPFGGAD